MPEDFKSAPLENGTQELDIESKTKESDIVNQKFTALKERAEIWLKQFAQVREEYNADVAKYEENLKNMKSEIINSPVLFDSIQMRVYQYQLHRYKSMIDTLDSKYMQYSMQYVNEHSKFLLDLEKDIKGADVMQIWGNKKKQIEDQLHAIDNALDHQTIQDRRKAQSKIADLEKALKGQAYTRLNRMKQFFKSAWQSVKNFATMFTGKANKQFVEVDKPQKEETQIQKEEANIQKEAANIQKEAANIQKEETKIERTAQEDKNPGLNKEGLQQVNSEISEKVIGVKKGYASGLKQPKKKLTEKIPSLKSSHEEQINEQQNSDNLQDKGRH